jgi:DNA-directed RNA polymerase subunit RPC12/RpoP
MATNYGKGLYKEYELLLSENASVKAEYKLLRKEHQLLQKEIKSKEKLELELAEKATEIEALKKEIIRLNALMNTDGTNSGTPTSKTPISKKKIIPNSRKKSDKKIGGQPGHKKKNLETFKEDEITEIEIHAEEECPYCGGKGEETENIIVKDELDYEVVVIKKRHQYPIYKCIDCGREFHQSIPNNLKEENQYGSNVQALSLSLMNIGNVSVNKVRKMIYGLSEEEINPSEGYIIKQQRKADEQLTGFLEELKKRCLDLETLYWDDTVIDINTTRGCLRFYGDDTIALYVAHQHKNKEGLDEDGILKLLSSDTIVMHDHNKVNYNKEYSFSNIECNVHMIRDLQKTTDNLKHEWSTRLKVLLENTNSQRNAAIESGQKAFENGYVKDFYREFDQIMLKAAEENKADYNKYYGKDERTLILRILKYKDNYLSWVVNFDLPFSNNLSERALRGIKSKMKISGQFQSEKSARNYAAVKSYIETCYRNGINEMQALIRLCEGNPYTVKEILENKCGD